MALARVWPRPTNPPRPRSSTAAPADRLEVILEDGDPSPSTPSIRSTRPFSRRYHFRDAGQPWDDSPPPSYSFAVGEEVDGDGDGHGDGGEKRRRNVRDRKFIARRGGWRRLLVAVVALVLVAVAVIVGVAVGLRKKAHPTMTANAPSAPSSSSPPVTGPFPAGSYSFLTFLDVVDASCTANPDTWRCYPDVTYRLSATASAATFNWIISATAATRPANFTIRSTENPFAPMFEGLPLQLLDEDLPTERYAFLLSIDKVVIPSSAITDDNAAASCYYNGTTFQAELYTKKPRTYPSPAPLSSSASAAASSPKPASATAQADDFGPWPFAVRIQQLIDAGVGRPTCYKTVDGRLADRIPDGPQPRPGRSSCSCLYRNWRDPN
ncbi:MAG: hypothetical protein M1826_005149 [Phylliscum demangeonii]|nr:MAG: hypothetical protein M1826_005149 [Phylliscum demangeonii]